MLTNVITTHDGNCLSAIFKIHCPNAQVIVDTTHNKGVMWSKCSYITEHNLKVIACDINPNYPVNVVADFFNL